MKMIDARRVIDIFDDDGNGEVDFKEFIMGLSHFRFMESLAKMLFFMMKSYFDFPSAPPCLMFLTPANALAC